jgi:hypothetical protein
VAGFQRTRRFDDERLDVFAPGVAHVSKQTLWVVIRCTSAVASKTNVVAGAGAR